jgi:hypothetical protein
MSSSSPLTAAQQQQLLDTVKSLLTGSNVAAVLTQLPSALIQLYQDVAVVYSATAAQQQALVVQLLQQAVAVLPGLSSADTVILNSVISSFVPVMLSYLPQIEAGVVKGFQVAESDVDSCLAWMGGLCSCCCPKAKAS